MSKHHQIPIEKALKQANIQADQLIKETLFLNADEGLSILNTGLEDIYHSVFGTQHMRIKAELADTEEIYQSGQKAIKAQRDKLSKTNRTISAPAKIEQDIPNPKARNRRKILDMLLALIMMGMAVGVLAIEVVTIATTILSSGNPVFIEAPWTAWAMAGLVPVGAFSIKFLKAHLPNDRAKNRYALFIYLMSTVLLLVWMILFSLIFENIGAGLDISEIMDASHGIIDPSTLTMVQLLTGAFVGGSLFSAASDILAKYSHDTEVTAPKYALGEKIAKDMERDLKPVADKYHTLTADNKALNSTKRNFITTNQLKHKRLRARFDASTVSSLK
tara:strand:+ start:225 stop:1220 length:996 start_codon:yes stop_codon:yes gene_type:complete